MTVDPACITVVIDTIPDDLDPPPGVIVRVPDYDDDSDE